MIDRRTKNAEIFRDTERRYTTDQALVQAVRQSIESQVFIAEKSTVVVPAPSKTEKAKVIVSGKRSLEAAESYAKQDKKVCVLNFASATNPGGGVVNGSSAQEECICRCTTLYPCLNTDQMWNKFYKPHRKQAGQAVPGTGYHCRAPSTAARQSDRRGRNTWSRYCPVLQMHFYYQVAWVSRNFSTDLYPKRYIFAIFS